MSWLLYALLALIGLAAALHGRPRLVWLMDIMLSGVLVAGLVAVSERRAHLLAAIGLCLPALALTWAAYGLGSPGLGIAAVLLRCAFLLFVSIVLLGRVLTERDVSGDTIKGALAIYLLLGLVFATGYIALELGAPGSFRIPEELTHGTDGGAPRSGHAGWALYFSYVTLTTLGYGDVSPLTPPAQMLAALEAIAGQIYLAVLIARLVGVHIAQRLTAPPEPPGGGGTP
jgi:hypothetical protein